MPRSRSVRPGSHRVHRACSCRLYNSALGRSAAGGVSRVQYISMGCPRKTAQHIYAALDHQQDHLIFDKGGRARYPTKLGSIGGMATMFAQATQRAVRREIERISPSTNATALDFAAVSRSTTSDFSIRRTASVLTSGNDNAPLREALALAAELVDPALTGSTSGRFLCARRTEIRTPG